MSDEERMLHDLWKAMKGDGNYGTGIEHEFTVLKTQIVTSLNFLTRLVTISIAIMTLIVGYLAYIATIKPNHSMLRADTPTQNASNVESRLQ